MSVVVLVAYYSFLFALGCGIVLLGYVRSGKGIDRTLDGDKWGCLVFIFWIAVAHAGAAIALVPLLFELRDAYLAAR